MNADIEPSQPNGGKNRVKNVETLGRTIIKDKMPLHLLHPPLHSQVVTLGDAHQYLLYIWNVLNSNLHEKRLPV